MTRDVDIIVVGGGVMGTAAAYALSRRGLQVTLLERFEIGHMRGSSGGPTRIFRFAYQMERYARMAEPAERAWRALEAASGESMLFTTGGVDIGERAHLAADALTAISRPFEWLDAPAASRRWPGIQFADDEPILFQPQAGVCYADRSVRAMARLAVAQGAQLREHSPVRVLEPLGADAVRVVTEDGDELRGRAAIVTAGSWAGPLLAQAGIELALTPTVEHVAYYRLAEPSPLPTLIDWSEHADPAEGFQGRGPYAVPDPEHPGDIKLALHLSGWAVDPTDGPFDVDPARIEEMDDWAGRRFAPLERTQSPHTCLYTRTPDHHFVIDREGPLVIGSPCSGHGFKFGPLIGELLADLATDMQPQVSLEGFEATRSAVRLPAPAAND